MATLQRALCMALASVPALSAAAVNDIYPTDNIPLPDGRKNVALYALNQEVSGLYTKGTRFPSGEISANLYALRIGRHYSFGDKGQYTFGPMAVLSWGEQTPDKTLKTYTFNEASGYGDLRLGSSVWFHIDRENREYAMVSASVLMPTGTYDKTKLLNMGENRYRYVLSAGWMRSLNERWVFDLSPEVVYYGDNTEYLVNRKRSGATEAAVELVEAVIGLGATGGLVGQHADAVLDAQRARCHRQRTLVAGAAEIAIDPVAAGRNHQRCALVAARYEAVGVVVEPLAGGAAGQVQVGLLRAQQRIGQVDAGRIG